MRIHIRNTELGPKLQIRNTDTDTEYGGEATRLYVLNTDTDTEYGVEATALPTHVQYRYIMQIQNAEYCPRVSV
jgi:hypothetical protein